MSTKISKKKFTEMLRSLIRKEIEEASTTASAGIDGTGTGHYDTPKAFSTGSGHPEDGEVAGLKKVKEQVNKLANSDTKINNYPLSQSTSIPTLITKNWEEYFTGPFGHNEEAVNKGLFLGKQLLKKLKVRNTVKKDIFENQKKGKLNSSKLYQAPFNENLFYRIEKEDYKNIFIHISLDLSGSMRGEKLTQTIQTAVAMAYAACNIKGFDVEISLRGTIDPNKTKHSSNQIPVLAYAFNSKKDSIKKLQRFKKCNSW